MGEIIAHHKRKKKIFIILKESIGKALVVALSKGIWISESGKFLLVESGIRNSGLLNAEYSSRNPDPTNDWNPESKFH